MVHAAVAHKKRTSLDHLQNNTTNWPNIDHRRVVRSSENELWRTIAPRANVRQVGLMCEYFCWAEVAKGHFSAFVENIVRFYVAMGDVKLMYEEQAPKNLITNDLDIHGGKAFPPWLLHKCIEVSLVASHHNIQVLCSFLNGSIAA